MPTDESTDAARVSQAEAVAPGLRELLAQAVEHLSHLGRIADGISRLAVAPAPSVPPPAVPEIDKETAAIAALLTVGPNVSKISRIVGVPRTTIYSWPKFREALARIDASGAARRGAMPRGRKVADTFEAWESDS